MIAYKLIKEEYEISDGVYKICCDIENDLLTITTPQGKPFQFINSDPEVVRLIAELIHFAATELK